MHNFSIGYSRLSQSVAAWIILLLVAPAALAQVSVAPTALFLNNQERFGAIHVSNGSSTTQEVTVDFRFGYPTADSTGSVFMQYEDSAAAEQFSIAEAVQAFPRRFMLPEGETQVVRLTARIPPDQPDGMYWTRVVTTSTPQAEFPDTATTGIQPRVIFRLQQVTALFYQQGTPDVSVALGDMEIATDSNQVDVFTDIEHTGNGPFLGSAQLRLFDDAGDLVQERRESIAVYVSDRRRFSFTLPDEQTAARVASAEVTLSPERTDIPRANLLNTAAVTQRVSLTP